VNYAVLFTKVPPATSRLQQLEDLQNAQPALAHLQFAPSMIAQFAAPFQMPAVLLTLKLNHSHR